MQPPFRSVALALCAMACGGTSDRADVTGAVGISEVNAVQFGDGLPHMSTGELDEMDAGSVEFVHNRDPRTGLGPVMTGIACSACHDSPPAIGGTNQRIETRFGRREADGGFDPLIAEGGPTLQDESIGTFAGVAWAAEQVPSDANVVAQRRTTPVFGLGLVDATPDATFVAVAAWQRAHHPEAAGRPAAVLDLATGKTAVGRFGWKAAQPTLLQFAADAFLNEMGVTTPFFPTENCPQGDCSRLSQNPAPGINDPDGVGMRAAAAFMTFLGPPPRHIASTDGAGVFDRIGCGVCHQQTLVTGPNPSAALDRVAYHPYSDFLLHDMAALGDGIDQGDAHGAEMRTQPLWGLAQQTRLLHDGRATTVEAAILAHDGQAKGARDRFSALGDGDRKALLAFLQAL